MTLSLDALLSADQHLFLWLNSHHTPFWDFIMAAITNKLSWLPLYACLVYSIATRFKHKAIGYLLCIILVVVFSDQVASGFMKPYFMRPRPCHDPMLQSLVHLVGGCGGPYGFASSHAATSFGIATSLLVLPTRQIYWFKWMVVWALIYSYSRIYVGVHYPLDCLGGAAVGTLLAFLLGKCLRYVGTKYPSKYL